MLVCLQQAPDVWRARPTLVAHPQWSTRAAHHLSSPSPSTYHMGCGRKGGQVHARMLTRSRPLPLTGTCSTNPNPPNPNPNPIFRTLLCEEKSLEDVLENEASVVQLVLQSNTSGAPSALSKHAALAASWTSAVRTPGAAPPTAPVANDRFDQFNFDSLSQSTAAVRMDDARALRSSPPASAAPAPTKSSVRVNRHGSIDIRPIRSPARGAASVPLPAPRIGERNAASRISDVIQRQEQLLNAKLSALESDLGANPSLW